jgi:general secretion pathway protein G
MKRLHPKSHAGFTLLEILLVIVIIISLMAVLIGSLRSSMKEAQLNTAGIHVNRISSSIARYELSNGRPPSTEQGLRALVEKPAGEPVPRRWSQIEEKLEPDPWGEQLHYEFPGKHNTKSFDVFSSGPDRQPGTDDDIGNWEK